MSFRAVAAPKADSGADVATADDQEEAEQGQEHGGGLQVGRRPRLLDHQGVEQVHGDGRPAPLPARHSRDHDGGEEVEEPEHQFEPRRRVDARPREPVEEDLESGRGRSWGVWDG